LEEKRGKQLMMVRYLRLMYFMSRWAAFALKIRNGNLLYTGSGWILVGVVPEKRIKPPQEEGLTFFMIKKK
jgi:hypothetical protein